MSITDVTVEPNVAGRSQPDTRVDRRAAAARWGRLIFACALVGASGGIRWWQARRVEAVLRDGRVAPLALNELPMTLGNWRGEPTTIDPRIARNTGATDLVTRRYVDQRTGATLEAIVLFGPSTEVYGHSPEVCYQAAGYDKMSGPDVRKIRTGDRAVPFRALVYTKGEGGQADLHEVYYSWRYSSHWSPDVMSVYKRFERIPGMIKVHLARRVTENERRDIGNPCESFLEVLLPELERRLSPAWRSSEGGAR